MLPPKPFEVLFYRNVRGRTPFQEWFEELGVAQKSESDVVNGTIGFQALASATGLMEKSLMRMLSVKGNPQAKNLFSIIHALQQLNEVNLVITASPQGTGLSV